MSINQPPDKYIRDNLSCGFRISEENVKLHTFINGF